MSATLALAAAVVRSRCSESGEHTDCGWHPNPQTRRSAESDAESWCEMALRAKDEHDALKARIAYLEAQVRSLCDERDALLRDWTKAAREAKR